jgi:hypothetical protein
MLKKLLAAGLTALITIMFVAMGVTAQPVTGGGGGLSRVNVTGGGLSGTGTTTNP